MDIFSKYAGEQISISGYVNSAKNIILHHNSLEEYIRTYYDEIIVEYDFVCASIEHSVVVCRLYNKDTEYAVTAVGETCKESLSNSFANYPTLIASQIAFDRAAIRYLKLPVNTYSSLEFLYNSIDENLPDKNEKIDAGDYILSFGIFSSKPVTVKEALQIARYSDSVKANIKKYLSENITEIKDDRKKYGVCALKRYCQRIKWEGLYEQQK